MATPSRILLLRSDRIGDAVIFSGVPARIRAHWPNAQLDLMVPSAVRPLFARCPHVDHLYSTNRLLPWEYVRRHVPRGTWAMERFLLRRRLRALWYPRYDVVIYAVSAPIEPYLQAVRLLDATEKWGYAGDQLRLHEFLDDENRPELVFTRAFVNRPDARWMHEHDRTREFLRFCGVDPGPLKPELWLTLRDRAFAQHALRTDNVLGFFVGAGSSWRQWPARKWAALALNQAISRHIALLGGRDDQPLAHDLSSSLRAGGLSVVDLTGKTRLGELAACIERCRAVVSNDSSGLHLAVAANVPTVGILGGYHFGRFYPWGDPRVHRVANVPMSCYHCNDECRFGDWRCVSDVPVETVLRELQIAVSESAKGSP